MYLVLRRSVVALSVATALAGFTAAAHASGTHAGGQHEEMAIGKPGEAGLVVRTVDVVMRETPDGRMVFEPAFVEVTQGETVRFAVWNEGVLAHEMVMDTQKAVMKHKATMERFPEMIHDDPNSINLEPGASGDMIWTFTNAGRFTFGCLIPGHYSAGMHGRLVVNPS